MPAGDEGLRELRAMKPNVHVDGFMDDDAGCLATTKIPCIRLDTLHAAIDRLLAARAPAVAATEPADADPYREVGMSQPQYREPAPPPTPGLRFRANVHAGTCARAAQLDQQVLHVTVPVEIVHCMGTNRSCRCVIEPATD